MENRTVLAPGATVDLGNGLEGRVLEVCLKAQGEQYRVAWWNGRTRVVESLRGKNLACFCMLDEPCHADVLLELANL